MPIELEPDALQRRVDAQTRDRVAQRHPGAQYGFAVVKEGAPQRSTNGPQCAESEQASHES